MPDFLLSFTTKIMLSLFALHDLLAKPELNESLR